MPVLRLQLDRWTETFSDLAASAEDRYRDAERLIVSGRHRGAVYFFGLAAEMWLKLASYRRFNAVASDPVGPHARNVRLFMDAHAPTTQRESGHSLSYWAEFLLLANRGMSRGHAGQLRHHVINRLFLDWKIELRYRPAAVSIEHARRVSMDAAWLRSNWDRLWR
jgi:hypothetical protein